MVQISVDTSFGLDLQAVEAQKLVVSPRENELGRLFSITWLDNCLNILFSVSWLVPEIAFLYFQQLGWFVRIVLRFFIF
jgi:hypothetical protein